MSNHVARQTLRACDFGCELIPYGKALSLQEKIWELCRAQSIPDTLLQLQHPPVYTLGKRGKEIDLLLPKADLVRLGAECFTVPRGGETTFHGPGQLVMYPILNLRRLCLGARAYVEGLEDTVIDTLKVFEIESQGRQPGRTGVWVGDRKIAAIGVKISQGTTTHGLAVNVDTDLASFKHIIPCGMADKEMTSISKEKGDPYSLRAVSNALRRSFITRFGYENVEEASEAQLLDC